MTHFHPTPIATSSRSFSALLRQRNRAYTTYHHSLDCSSSSTQGTPRASRSNGPLTRRGHLFSRNATLESARPTDYLRVAALRRTALGTLRYLRFTCPRSAPQFLRHVGLSESDSVRFVPSTSSRFVSLRSVSFRFVSFRCRCALRAGTLRDVTHPLASSTLRCYTCRRFHRAVGSRRIVLTSHRNQKQIIN